MSANEENAMNNPVGWLHETCASRRWAQPYFYVESEEHFPDKRIFTIACEMLKQREVGTGESKKLAKRQAAQKMCKTLQSMSLDSNDMLIAQTAVKKQMDHTKNVDCLKLLLEIASEKQFEITFFDIEEKSTSGEYRCLLQLSTTPIAICSGFGSSLKEAQSCAAQNALEYLKILTKKFEEEVDSVTTSMHNNIDIGK